MKKLLFLLLSTLVVNANAQIKRIKLLEKEIGPITLLYQKSVNLDTGDSLYFAFLGFQNAKYTSITDRKSIAFSDNSKLNEFIKDLKSAHKLMELDEKVSMEWKKESYSIILYDFTKELYLETKRGVGGYTIINKNGVLNLINVLLRIQLGKDEVLPE